jgi:hypothetical protein
MLRIQQKADLLAVIDPELAAPERASASATLPQQSHALGGLQSLRDLADTRTPPARCSVQTKGSTRPSSPVNVSTSFSGDTERHSLQLPDALTPVEIVSISSEKIKTTVHKLTYQEGCQQKVGYFKPSDRGTENFPLKAISIGIDSTNPRFDKREVAASIVGAHLIPGMVPCTRLAIHNGKSGHIQDEAQGQCGSRSFDFENMRPEGDKTILPIKESAMSDGVKNQLGDLHVFDYLIGNVDRHPETTCSMGNTLRRLTAKCRSRL